LVFFAPAQVDGRFEPFAPEDDDIESEEDAILGGSNAAGARADDANALVRNHDRLSLDRVIFRGLKSLPTLTDSSNLPHTAPYRFATSI
jgi:hypothetical protein